MAKICEIIWKYMQVYDDTYHRNMSMKNASPYILSIFLVSAFCANVTSSADIIVVGMMAMGGDLQINMSSGPRQGSSDLHNSKV
jgi:hypothetical protein